MKKQLVQEEVAIECAWMNPFFPLNVWKRAKWVMMLRWSGLRCKTAIINVASVNNKLPENWKLDKCTVITHLADLLRRHCAERIERRGLFELKSFDKGRLTGLICFGCRKWTILRRKKLARDEITSLVNAVHEPQHIHLRQAAGQPNKGSCDQRWWKSSR